MKKLSIIITAYNIEQYIGECLDSIIHQLTSECELFVIDDSSTDKTLEIIQSKIDTKIQKNINIITHSVNCGVSVARNTGLYFSSGKYVAFIDGDDLVTDEYIATIMIALTAEMDVYKLSWVSFGLRKAMYDANRLPEWNKSVWSRVFKRTILQHTFNPHLSWAEDADFIDKNVRPEHTVGIIPKVIYKYRWMRKGSITEQRGK